MFKLDLYQDMMALRAFIQPGNLMRFTPSIAVCIFMKYKHASSLIIEKFNLTMIHSMIYFGIQRKYENTLGTVWVMFILFIFLYLIVPCPQIFFSFYKYKLIFTNRNMISP